MTKHRDLFAALAAPFERGQVKQKLGYDYVTVRSVMNRLDEVLGPENWWDDYVPLKDSVICKLTIRLPDGQLLTKVDAGGYADMSSKSGKEGDPGDEDKAGFSDALKRAAVKFGVFRYGYKDGVAKLAGPEAEAPAPPPAPAPTLARAGSEDAQGRGGRSVYGQARSRPASNEKPKTGEDLHYYAADNKIDPNLANWIINSFNPQGFPVKIVDWTPDEVRQALPSIREHLETVKQSRARMKAIA